MILYDAERYRLQSDALEALSAVVVEFDRRIRNHFGDSQVSVQSHLNRIEAQTQN